MGKDIIYNKYYLYLQRSNGYWIREPFDTFEEAKEYTYTLDENEFWWYMIVYKEQNKDNVLDGGRIYTREEYEQPYEPKSKKR